MIWFSEIVRVMEIIMFAEIVRLVLFNKPEWNVCRQRGDGGTTI